MGVATPDLAPMRLVLSGISQGHQDCHAQLSREGQCKFHLIIYLIISKASCEVVLVPAHYICVCVGVGVCVCVCVRERERERVYPLLCMLVLEFEK